MAVIRHRSVIPGWSANLEIRLPSLKKPILQPVAIGDREGNQVLIQHANGWTRVLQTKSGNSDGGVYVETDTRTPREITFRLLTGEEPNRTDDQSPHFHGVVNTLKMATVMELHSELRR